jgi:hypothetical protein
MWRGRLARGPLLAGGRRERKRPQHMVSDVPEAARFDPETLLALIAPP